jgi:hypothetical protein
MSAPTKFCVDCKHHTLLVGTERCGFLLLRERTVTEHRCTAFRQVSTDPVTGEVTVFAADADCLILRGNPHVCGPEAKRWEPRA